MLSIRNVSKACPNGIPTLQRSPAAGTEAEGVVT